MPQTCLVKCIGKIDLNIFLYVKLHVCMQCRDFEVLEIKNKKWYDEPFTYMKYYRFGIIYEGSRGRKVTFSYFTASVNKVY